MGLGQAMNVGLVLERNLNRLQTNVVFDTVEEKKKPGSRNPDYLTNSLDSTHESASSGTINNPSLSDVPNLYKQNGNSVENLGYFIFPRSVANDPRFLSARLKYQKVLWILFEYAAFSPTTHAVGPKKINIEIGQFCVTVRGLAEICNQGVKHEEDKLDRNIIVRAISYFEKCHFVRQEVRHGKMLLSITVPEFYDRMKKRSETTSETKARQDRDSKEEDKELKEDNIFNPSVAVAPSEGKKFSSSSKKRKKTEPVPLVERDKGVFISDIAHQKLVEEKGSEEIVKQIYSAMAVWKAQNGISGGDDYRTALKWSISPKAQPRTFNKPTQPKYNHDTSPSLPSKSISFAEEV